MATKNSKLIFLVEDDPFYRAIIYNYLMDREYGHVECYESANHFSDNLYKNPDIIFLDYNLDDRNGLNILKEIKAYNPDIHVVFLSAQDTIQVAVDALRYGALEYIIKNDVALEKINNVFLTISKLDQMIKRHGKKNKTIINTLSFLLISVVLLFTFLLLR